MNIIVVGGGKVGFYLVQTLINHGHKATLIEENRVVCKKLANDLDIPIICGDGSSIAVLEAANITEADALISVTGKDQDNLVTCQLAKKRFNVPKTVARVNNPKNMEIMRLLGVDIPISSTNNIAALLEREVDAAAIKQLVTINRGEASLSEMQLPQDYELDGKTLMQLPLPEESIIVSITRKGNLIIPRGNTSIHSGDKIIVLCANTAVHELSEVLKLSEEHHIGK